jgi:hypothetical protein
MLLLRHGGGAVHPGGRGSGRGCQEGGTGGTGGRPSEEKQPSASCLLVSLARISYCILAILQPSFSPYPSLSSHTSTLLLSYYPSDFLLSIPFFPLPPSLLADHHRCLFSYYPSRFLVSLSPPAHPPPPSPCSLSPLFAQVIAATSLILSLLLPPLFPLLSLSLPSLVTNNRCYLSHTIPSTSSSLPPSLPLSPCHSSPLFLTIPTLQSKSKSPAEESN